MNTNQFACHSEYLFALRCMEQGYQVSMPLLDSSVYDIIVDTGKKLVKVQVKATYKEPSDRNNNIHVPISRESSVMYKLSDIDFLAIYSKYYKVFFVFKYTKIMKALRLNPDGLHKSKFNNFDLNL